MKRYLLFFLSLWRPNNRISGNQVFRNNTWKPGNVFGNPDISGQTQIPENQENLKTRRLNLKKKTYYMELDHLVTILNQPPILNQKTVLNQVDVKPYNMELDHLETILNQETILN